MATSFTSTALNANFTSVASFNFMFNLFICQDLFYIPLVMVVISILKTLYLDHGHVYQNIISINWFVNLRIFA